ncbi:MAG: hypothetical protein MZW92_51360 [Comamonadaceae bacterium]|nr:hypothetical protein [Comamonadaceae bacterium]
MRIDRRRKLPVDHPAARARHDDAERSSTTFFDDRPSSSSAKKACGSTLDAGAPARRAAPTSTSSTPKRRGDRRGRPTHHRARTCASCDEAGLEDLRVPTSIVIGRYARRRRGRHRDRRDLIAAGQRRASPRTCSTKLVEQPASPTSRRSYTNDLDHRPVHLADTLRHRRDRDAHRGAGRDLPHDASGRAADPRRRRRTCSTACSSTPSATTCRRSAA